MTAENNIPSSYSNTFRMQFSTRSPASRPSRHRMIELDDGGGEADLLLSASNIIHPSRQAQRHKVPSGYADWVIFFTMCNDQPRIMNSLMTCLPFPDLCALMGTNQSIYNILLEHSKHLSLKNLARDFTNPQCGDLFARFTDRVVSLNLVGAGIPTLPDLSSPILNERMHLPPPGQATMYPATCKQMWDNLHGLDRLDLSFFQGLSDRDIEWISRYCRKLTYLNLVGCPFVTDAALHHIADGFVKLKELHISIAYVKPSSIRKVLQALPALTLHMPFYNSFGEKILNEFGVRVRFLYHGDNLFGRLRDPATPGFVFANAVVITHVGELHEETGMLIQSRQVFHFGGRQNRITHGIQNNISTLSACILANDSAILLKLLEDKADVNVGRPLLNALRTLIPKSSSDSDSAPLVSKKDAVMMIRDLSDLRARTLDMNYPIYATLQALKGLPHFPRRGSWPRNLHFIIRPCHIFTFDSELTAAFTRSNQMSHNKDIKPLFKAEGTSSIRESLYSSRFPFSSLSLALQGGRFDCGKIIVARLRGSLHRGRYRNSMAGEILDLLCFTDWDKHWDKATKFVALLSNEAEISKDIMFTLASRNIMHVSSNLEQAAFNTALDHLVEKLQPDFKLTDTNRDGDQLADIALRVGNGPLYHYLGARLPPQPDLPSFNEKFRSAQHFSALLNCCAAGELKLLKLLIKSSDFGRQFDTRKDKLDLSRTCQEIGMPIPSKFYLVHFARSVSVIDYLVGSAHTSVNEYLNAKMTLLPMGSGSRPLVELFPFDVALLTDSSVVSHYASLHAPCRTQILAIWLETKCWPSCADWKLVIDVLLTFSVKTLISLNSFLMRCQSILHLLYSSPDCYKLITDRSIFVDLMKADPSNLNFTDPEGWTLLHHCCSRQEFLLIKEILAQPDVVVNIQSHKYEVTPLHILCEIMDRDSAEALICVELLLNHPSAMIRRGIEEFPENVVADTDIMDGYGCTPVSISLFRDAIHSSALQQIIDDDILSPLSRLLLKYGGSLRVKQCRTGRTAFHCLPEHIKRYGWNVDTKHLYQVVKLWRKHGNLSLNAVDFGEMTGFDLFSDFFLSSNLPDSAFIGWSKKELLDHLFLLGCKSHKDAAEALAIDTQVHYRRLFDAAERADFGEIRLLLIQKIPLNAELNSKLPIHFLGKSKDLSFRNNRKFTAEGVRALLGKAGDTCVDVNVMDMSLETPLSLSLETDSELEDRKPGESIARKDLPISCLSATLLQVGATMKDSVDSHSGKSLLHNRLRAVMFDDGPNGEIDPFAIPWLRSISRWISYGRLDPNLQDQSALSALDYFLQYVPDCQTKAFMFDSLKNLGFKTSDELLNDMEDDGAPSHNSGDELVTQHVQDSIDVQEDIEEEEEIISYGFSMVKEQRPLFKVQAFVHPRKKLSVPSVKWRGKIKVETNEHLTLEMSAGHPPLSRSDQLTRDLLSACGKCSIEMIASLVRLGANIDAEDDFGQSPLFLYVSQSLTAGQVDLDIVQLLSSPKIINLKFNGCFSVLALSLLVDALKPTFLSEGPSELSRTLKASGGTLETHCALSKKVADSTVWHGIAQSLWAGKSSWLAKWLIRVNHVTPLKISTLCGVDLNSVCIMLECFKVVGSLDLNQKNVAGFSGLDILIDRYFALELNDFPVTFSTMVAILSGRGCKAFVFAENVKYASVAASANPMLSSGAEASVDENASYLALHAATKALDVDKMRILIQSGLRIDERDDMRRLPIHLLFESDSGSIAQDKLFEAVSILISGRRGDLNLCNSAGHTPLSICLRRDAINASLEMKGNLFRVRPEGGLEVIKFSDGITSSTKSAGSLILTPSPMSQFLKRHGATLRTQAFPSGNTVLHSLCARLSWRTEDANSTETLPFHVLFNIIRLWKEHGDLDVKHVNREGFTALQILDARAATGELGLSTTSYSILRPMLLAFHLL